MYQENEKLKKSVQGLKDEKDRVLINANSLISEIDQIKKEFAEVETQAQNKFTTKIENLKA